MGSAERVSHQPEHPAGLRDGPACRTAAAQGGDTPAAAPAAEPELQNTASGGERRGLAGQFDRDASEIAEAAVEGEDSQAAGSREGGEIGVGFGHAALAESCCKTPPF